MEVLELVGGRPLEGALHIQGAKNSVLPILTAALLAPGESVIHNCPELSDVAATLEILEGLGCPVRRLGNTVTIQGAHPAWGRISPRLMGEMRSSVIFLGALLARMGWAELSYPGGCALGPRPIDLHLAALRELGAEIVEEQGMLRANRGRGLVGRQLYLSTPSVGATENIMLAACGAVGVTTLVGAAREPEIVDLQGFLRGMGARITGAGSSIIRMEGGRPLHPVEYTVMGDRIVAATYLCGGAAAGGCLELTGVPVDTLEAVTHCLAQGGCALRAEGERVWLDSRKALGGIPPVRTAPYPGFPTDAQPLLMAALAAGRGTTMIEENLFSSRYRHVDELARMGADIQVSGRVAVVTGRPLHGALVQSTDLRGGAALAVAGLAAQGITQIGGLEYIRRGYQSLEQDLAQLGAQVRPAIISEEKPRGGEQERHHGISPTQPNQKAPAQPQPVQCAV